MQSESKTDKSETDATEVYQKYEDMQKEKKKRFKYCFGVRGTTNY